MFLEFLCYSQWARDISFLLDFHRDVDRSHTDNEVKSLYDIFFQYHNDVVQCKLDVIEIPIFNVALKSDKDINKIIMVNTFYFTY